MYLFYSGVHYAVVEINAVGSLQLLKGAGEEGGWQQGRLKNKRAAQREGDEVPEKQKRTKSPEELVVLRVKGTKPGDAGFKAINPLQIDMSLQNQIGSRALQTPVVIRKGVQGVAGNME